MLGEATWGTEVRPAFCFSVGANAALIVYR